jgi:SEC-C motif
MDISFNISSRRTASGPSPSSTASRGAIPRIVSLKPNQRVTLHEGELFNFAAPREKTGDDDRKRQEPSSAWLLAGDSYFRLALRLPKLLVTIPPGCNSRANDRALRERRRFALLSPQEPADDRASSCDFILEGAMKAGRNDPWPCGSGKKYKKCCLGKELAASATQPSAFSSELSAAGSRGPASSGTRARESVSSGALAQATATQEPPALRDPIAERADRCWEEFESQSQEGRIAIFLETLEDAEVMTDNMAFEMLACLHSDALERGERARFPEFVGALRERRPKVYEESAHSYLSWCVQDALAENRLESVASPTRDLAARAGYDIDVFDRVADALAYHGQLSVLAEAFRIA